MNPDDLESGVYTFDFDSDKLVTPTGDFTWRMSDEAQRALDEMDEHVRKAAHDLTRSLTATPEPGGIAEYIRRNVILDDIKVSDTPFFGSVQGDPAWLAATRKVQASGSGTSGLTTQDIKDLFAPMSKAQPTRVPEKADADQHVKHEFNHPKAVEHRRRKRLAEKLGNAHLEQVKNPDPVFTRGRPPE